MNLETLYPGILISRIKDYLNDQIDSLVCLQDDTEYDKGRESAYEDILKFITNIEEE